LADLGALRALLDRFVRLLRLLRAVDDFAKAHGLGLFFWYPKWIHQEGQGVWLTRHKRGATKCFVSIGLKEEVLTVATAARREEGGPTQPLGEVDVSDPGLCEKTMALVEQGWEIVGPRGSEDLDG
jgi:hypothetical protein